MHFNFEYIKKHPAIAGAIVVGVLIVVYLLVRSKGSTSGVGGILAQVNAGQLQMAQLNAQLSAQGEQTQAQLQAQEIAANAQVQQQENQIAGSLVNSQLVYGNQAKIVQEELASHTAIFQSLLPQIENLLNRPGLQGHQALQETTLQELELLLAEGAGPLSNPSFLAASGSLPNINATPGGTAGFNINIPGVGSVGVGGL